MVFIDSHTHLFDLKRGYALPQDVYPVVVGYSDSSNRKAVECARAGGYPFALGIAPQTAIKEGTGALERWVGFIRESGPNAIGEVGLDYKWAQSREHIESEKAVFMRMIGLADELGVPLVIHSRDNPSDNGLPRDAIGDILPLIGKRRFLMHFFSGSEPQARTVVGMGGYISMTGIRSKEKRKVINSVPIERLLIESDSPYIGRTPESAREAAAYIAEAKGLQISEVEKATAENAMSFFGFRVRE